MARLLSGHFPHRAFWLRFNLDGYQQCWYCKTLETRDHILYQCKLWSRGFSHKSKPEWKHRLLYDFEHWEEQMIKHSNQSL